MAHQVVVAVVVAAVVVVVVVVLTSTRIIKSVVTGQVPVTLELRTRHHIPDTYYTLVLMMLCVYCCQTLRVSCQKNGRRHNTTILSNNKQQLAQVYRVHSHASLQSTAGVPGITATLERVD